MKKILFLVLASLLLAGCATVTVPRTVYRPWSRTLMDQDIQVGASMSVSVETMSSPLLGSEKLVENRIAEKATALLERRGFTFRDSNPQYNLKISYQVTPELQEVTSNSSYSGSRSAAYTRSTNLGVMLAQSVAATSTQNAVQTQTTSVKYEVYSHLIACEISDQSGKLVWKYDSRADYSSMDILDIYTPLLQVAFSSLPTSGEVIPRVPKMKTGRYTDYASIYVKDKYIMCPALPNYIIMSEYGQSVDRSASLRDRYGIENQYDGEAMLAFLDLLETAEYAIPGKHGWEEATLMGRYIVGNYATPVNLVIDLKGTPSCYIVQKARLVNDKEYSQLQQVFNQWIQRITEYFDFFED